MKISKKQEAKVLKVYKTYFDFYIKGDVKGIAELLDADYNQIGSAESEVFFNKKDAVKFLFDTIDQLAGKTKIKNRELKVEPLDGYMLVTDLFDIYVLDKKNWAFYSKFRASTLMHDKEGKWKIVHQHSSIPDSNAEEGDNIAIEKISEENKELRDAIKRRTVELENKNRELEIESALEKVRSRTMAMQHSDELQEISFLLDSQVRALGIKTWGCAFNIYGENESTEWFGNEAGVLPTYTVPRKGIFKEYFEIGKKGESFYIKEFSGAPCVAHYEYMSSLPVIGDVLKDLKKTNNGFPTYQIDHVVYFKYGYLLFITKEHVPNAHDIFKRFTAVFEQTYTRFLDLQKAEAQVREAQIGAALEKVRSRTMAMQKGEEIKDVVVLLYKELIALGVNNFATCGYVEINEKTNLQSTWVTSPGGDSLELFYLPLTGDVHFDQRYKAWKKQQRVFHQTVAGKERKKHLEYAITTFNSKEAEEMVLNQFPDPTVFYCFNFLHGYLHLVSGSKLKEEEESLLVRFTRVFEQTYARFLDLQKAEAQARESQIETALERIRAQAVAMKESSDLLDIVVTMRNEFIKLGHEAHYFWHMMWLPEIYEKAMTSGDGSRIGFVMKLPRHIHGDIPLLAKWEKSKKPTVVYAMDAETAIDYVDKMVNLGDFKNIDPQAPSHDDVRHIGGLTFIMARTSHGEIGYSLPGIVKNPPKEDLDILVRFAAAFDLAHQRFLDLQKAEAQARETQIELALEKVRSRSMAMHKSDELKEVVKVIFNQMDHLNINADHAGIVVDYEPKKDFHFWVADNQDIPAKITVPYLDLVWDNQFTKAKKKGKDFFTTQLDFKEKNSFYKKLLPHIKGLTKQARDFYLNCPGLTASTVIQKDIGLYIENFSGIPFSNEENSILMRFGKAFQQTYTRFLDLQKAETQGKEAQIELALERVRASTMAMQQSDELQEVVLVFYEQLQHLNIEANGCNIIIFEDESGGMRYWVSGFTQNIYPESYHVPFLDHPYLTSQIEAWKRNEKYAIFEYSGEEKKRFDELFFSQTEFKNIPTKAKQVMKSLKKVKLSTAYFTYGALQVLGSKAISTENEKTLQRLSKVFNQAYTRFLDLQKAEAQAREAQIEAALERTRTQSMLMQHSDELDITSQVFHEQLQLLGIQSSFSYLWLLNEVKEQQTFWATYSENKKGKIQYRSKKVSYHLDKTDPYMAECLMAWKAGEKSHLSLIPAPEVEKYFEEWDELFSNVKNLKPESFPEGLRFIDAYMKYGTFGLVSDRDLTKEEYSILSRFAIEFERTYTRFLELKKAEDQAREAQIETALEKVRSRTMGMQQSDELQDAAMVLFEQVEALGVPTFASGFNIWAEDKKTATAWMARKNGFQPPFQTITADDVYLPIFKAQQKGESLFILKQDGKDLVAHYKYLTTIPEVKAIEEELLRNGLSFPEFQIIHCAYFSKGYLMFISYEPVPEAHDIFKRFAQVFEQTYTRFLDLQKAEAQAREAQIEASLERVRSKSMAMHKSKDIGETVSTLFSELLKIGIHKTSRSGIGILNDSKYMKLWSGITNSVGEIDLHTGMLDMTITPLLKKIKRAWKTQNKHFYYELEGEELYDYYDSINNSIEYSLEIDLNKLPEKETADIFSFKHGIIYSFNNIPIPEEAKLIFKRFAKVFEQTYTRFLDIQKAEIQAREAQIEGALEKVRSRTMAMQQSEELPEAANNLFLQVQALGIPAWSAGYCIFDNDKKTASCNMSSEGVIQKSFTLPSIGEGYNFYAPLKRGETFYVSELGGEALVKHYEFMTTLPIVGEIFDGFQKAGIALPTFQVWHIVYFTHGYLMFITYESVPDAHDIFKRFTAVFEQTYTRFLDLKKAETMAQKAKIEVALERVRARALAMQKPEELKDVAQVLRHEMGALGIEELETSSIYIHDKKTDKTECWYALKDVRKSKKKLVSDHFSLNLKDTWVGREMLKFYNSNKKQISIVMKGHHRKEWINMCEELSAPFRGYYGDVIPDRTYHLYKFSHGAIGVATPGDISAENWDLLKRTASVFSLAYSRFNDLTKARIDLKRLKTEKHRAEEALTELKSTQSQLIQSEKMASLGELTAGIAHEIQNPLNFVNNFSEVSNELIDEMHEEIEKGDLDEAKIIAEDVKQNLEKINHHGKRAEAIIKGMLQHSRSSSGEKEPTDINALADEYLRLAYHGLRAKDKSFNAALETDYDETIGDINIIPQDIGRVILNLITNAFYAVNEKQISGIENFEPTVSLITKKKGKRVSVLVGDNGNGIPKNVLDKIFQPFFTTKPTGMGTGLGLSMSYEIVTKGHGGELKVESIPGKGSKFIISLPL